MLLSPEAWRLAAVCPDLRGAGGGTILGVRYSKLNKPGKPPAEMSSSC